MLLVELFFRVSNAVSISFSPHTSVILDLRLIIDVEDYLPSIAILALTATIEPLVVSVIIRAVVYFLTLAQ